MKVAIKLTFLVDQTDQAIDLSTALSLKLGTTIMQGFVPTVSKIAWQGLAGTEAGLMVSHVPANKKIISMWRAAFQAHNNTAEYRQLMEDPGEFTVGWNCVSLYQAPSTSYFSHVDPDKWCRLDGSYICAPQNTDSVVVVADEEGNEWKARFSLVGNSAKGGVATVDGVTDANIAAGYASIGLIDMYNSSNPIDDNSPPETDAWGSPIENDVKNFAGNLYAGLEWMIIPERGNSVVEMTSDNVIGLQRGGFKPMCGLLRIGRATDLSSVTRAPAWITQGSSRPYMDVPDFTDADGTPGGTEAPVGYLHVWVDDWSEF